MTTDEAPKGRISNRRVAIAERMADIISMVFEGQGIVETAEGCADLALEEAAKVAEQMSDGWATEWRKGLKCDSHMEGMTDGADDVAAAIRSLKS